MRPGKLLRNQAVVLLLLFGISLLLRLLFFSGFILCDDAEEFALMQHILAHGADFKGHLQYRFPMWVFNVASMRVLGSTEGAFFLPTLLMSATLPLLAFLLLRRSGYSELWSCMGGIFLASAPFEVLTGGLRANDVILEWFVALALCSILFWRERPVRQGFWAAAFMYLAFYTKLWAVYLLPLLGAYYLFQALRHRKWHGLAVFTLTSALLHTATAIYWKIKLGVYFPYLQSYSATYPVPRKDLLQLFTQYPQRIFLGAEFGTTLFGFVPYLLVLLLAAKLVLVRRGNTGSETCRWDFLDTALAGYYTSFFLLLNFFPNSFQFDQYYSAPRIFRYLAPLSFPMALHAAKLMMDLGRMLPAWCRTRRVAVPLCLALLGVNVWQADQATGPGRLYRRALKEILSDLKGQCPPQMMIDFWPAFFMEQVYLRESCPQTQVLHATDVYSTKDYERWLASKLTELNPGAALVTGLTSCVHYGCTDCGFRMRRFTVPLDKRWVLTREYNTLAYLPDPEPPRLWRWQGGAVAASPPGAAGLVPAEPQGSFESLFKEGMALLDAGKNREARKYYATILDNGMENSYSEDATYFLAITYWREGDRQATISEMTKLIARYPAGRWAAGGFYHIAMAQQQLGLMEEARGNYRQVLDKFPQDQSVCRLARDRLAELPPEPLWKKILGR